jgi:SAM-dependent methyltransferase
MARDRSLLEVNRKIVKKSPDILGETLTDLLKQGDALNVLEVGFGHGRALLELAQRFRDRPVTFYGVDKTKAPPVEQRSDLAEIARIYQIAPEAELATLRLPEIDFYDATTLHFEDESMNLVYSAVTIRFIERKAEFLEEVCRVLRPGGIALLHIGESRWDYPYGPIVDDKMLTPYRSRFVLKNGHELIPLPAYLELFAGDAFRFTFINQPRCVLWVHKVASGRLQLQLTFNSTLSFPMRELPYGRGGFRTVYDVPAETVRILRRKEIMGNQKEVFAESGPFSPARSALP